MRYCASLAQVLAVRAAVRVFAAAVIALATFVEAPPCTYAAQLLLALVPMVEEFALRVYRGAGTFECLGVVVVGSPGIWAPAAAGTIRERVRRAVSRLLRAFIGISFASRSPGAI